MKTALQCFKRLSQEVKNCLGDVNVYLYGSSLRDIILGKTPDVFKVFIETRNIPDFLKVKLKTFKKFDFKFGKRIDLEDCNYTIDCVYVSLEDLLNNRENIIYTQTSEKDLGKGVLKLSKQGKQNITTNPSIILDTVLLMDELNFYLDPNTINFIFTNRKELVNIEKRKIFTFLKNIVKTKKPRKVVSNVNTLSISSELFGFNLIENSSLNHLKENDFFEFITIIFSEVDIKEIESFLIDKCGFLFRDIPHILKIAEALDTIEGQDEDCARKFLSLIDKKRIPNICRLLRALDFKELSKNLKKEKSLTNQRKQLCINGQTIKSAFGITDDLEVKIMLDKALSKVINEPEFNTQSKILVYLNNERNILCQEEENHN